MGACLATPPSKLSSPLCQPSPTMSPSQTHLLRLMFQDLASRSNTPSLPKDTFDLFFNLNGLWRQSVFNYFDRTHQNQLSFQDLKTGLEKLVKGSLKERVHALFSFYGGGRSGGVSYCDIVSMVRGGVIQMFSYQKEELRKICDDEGFRESLGEEEREWCFGRGREEREVVEECGGGEKCGGYSKSNSYVTNTSNTSNNTCNTSPLQTKPSYRSIKSLPTSTLSPSSSKPLSSPSSSISYFDPSSKRTLKISSNISLLVQKYVDYLFHELHLNKTTDLITQQQFTFLISKHQQIFNSYYDGFHNYVWECEGEEGKVPVSGRLEGLVGSECYCYDERRGGDEETKVYVKLIKSTLFVFREEKDILPFEIVNLQGLQLEETSCHVYPGFLLKHPSPTYPSKHYLFPDARLYQLFLHHLRPFKNISFPEKYRLISKIGEGNFSTVYRGVDRGTGGEVAIKIMEKARLSAVQNYIVRHECEVLELCHHPCVVQFKERIESETHVYLITELLGDGDLWDYVGQEGGRLSERESCFIIKELLQTIQYLDTVGLIHRDIKPENIIIRKQEGKVERVKLIDFGFAVFKNSLDSLKGCEKYAGTPGYSAPEVVRFEGYDGGVDLWSVGVVLYFMLSGELPFEGEGEEVRRRMGGRVEVEVGMRGRGWRGVSDEAKDLVGKLLREREERIGVEEALEHGWIVGEEEKRAAGV